MAYNITTGSTGSLAKGGPYSGSFEAQAANEGAALLASMNAIYDGFDDRYLGPKASGPGLDNDSQALIAGAMYFDTVLLSMQIWNGSFWSNLAATITPVTGAIFENAVEIGSNYTITAGKNGMSAGPITINAGVTVTVPVGSNWSIV